MHRLEPADCREQVARLQLGLQARTNDPAQPAERPSGCASRMTRRTYALSK
ncbi:hypothetical protein [Sorangium cellulosum]|uniref:hypothetical protein n=1 Tax=Sorangium cellulosum TaxID=56 RepID=UPI0013315A12|nr:hypothetical protein [Sorangium cellulosum]